ncbi:AAA family ATPase [Promethearchaeum syntrophicum]|uniref:AAA family ATPase n=1 Tax=Promethearchaeum syntrophicum TaxID=2594042 RepID=A0A5B9DAX4_9ARCH|nr:MoxR family ATPase [Candidatus Prometheoarchaeum syntrophicum]QEE16399.1 replication factor C large subunit [Candidatus Prometheoarchaeum syntrophicum]
MNFDQFSGASKYITSPELKSIVNVSIALQRPLLVKGEPGTGKTLLAHAISEALEKPLLVWNVKSTSKAIDGCYTYDTVQRLNDSRFGSKKRNVDNVEDYITLGKLGQAFTTKEQVVLLIDEIDKADPEFPNDLLQELDIMEFYVNELQKTIKAVHRPIVIITSNNEKELPDAFLRRCVFHYINFPDKELMREIVHVHFPDIKEKILENCLQQFYLLRMVKQVRKKPSTSELIDWIGVLLKAGLSEEDIEQKIPFLGTLIKKEVDLNYLKHYRKDIFESVKEK